MSSATGKTTTAESPSYLSLYGPEGKHEVQTIHEPCHGLPDAEELNPPYSHCVDSNKEGFAYDGRR